MAYVAEGALVDPEALEIAGARRVRDATGWYPLAKLVETRARETEGRREEVVVIDVEPELPQDLVHDIRSVERLAVAFGAGERRSPVVTALRSDFPRVAHLNWMSAGNPRDLCVYEEPWSEVRLRWTGAGFLRDLVQWLSRTAVDDLHGTDQPLEPFLFETANVVVFPENVFDELAAGKVFAAQVVQERPGWPYTVKLGEFAEGELADARRMYCAAAVGTPTAQEAMRDCPRSLMEFSSVLGDVGVDLWANLRSRLGLWYSGARRPRDDDGVVVLLRLPRSREAGGDVEEVQYLAFELHPIKELAMASGRFGSVGVGGQLVPLAGGDVDEGLAAFIDVVPMRAMPCLDRATARLVSGLEPAGEEPNVVLVGAGALGSQMHEHLSGMGWGRWTLVDRDTLLPHNVARHRLGENALGFSKVRAIAQVTGTEAPYNAVERVFLADAQASESDEELLSAYGDADLILDASASVSVSRFLARDIGGSARRASVFVNPAGRDAVMLIEDAERSLTLDALEAQYHRAVLSDERLAGHISLEPRVRYAAGCRDVAARLAQDDLVLSSGLLCRQIRTAGPDAAAVVWRTAADGSVERIEIPVVEAVRVECDGWGFVLDGGVVGRAARQRRRRLPNETGGVLIGYFDVPRKAVYVVDALPAPRDSVEHKEAFVRGYAGLREELAAINARSGGQVGYVGEWHSHPDGAGVGMSPDDTVLLATIAEEMHLEGWPGVMMVVGGDTCVGFYTQGW